MSDNEKEGKGVSYDRLERLAQGRLYTPVKYSVSRLEIQEQRRGVTGVRSRTIRAISTTPSSLYVENAACSRKSRCSLSAIRLPHPQHVSRPPESNENPSVAW